MLHVNNVVFLVWLIITVLSYACRVHMYFYFRIINISLTLKLYGIDVKIPKYTPAEPLADVECVIFNVIVSHMLYVLNKPS